MTPPVPAILALVSAPLVDLNGEPVPPLDADRELADLEDWLREPGCAVELYVEWAEAERLQRALLRRRFDALHYTGHGNRDALAFEDGRARELHQLVGPLLDNRLTVLTGMGGMGKTELAREAGRWLAARGHFADGIGWADLRDVTDLALVRARLAEAANLSPEAARSDGDLAAALSSAPRLLILDALDQAVRHDLVACAACWRQSTRSAALP